ncbi:MAG: hypothetical protein K8F91_08475 [Candidatus Obscuribacterales bacterium]|nr:hypothetical protein [Candidatus Obscuribacterales bacterium]
MNLTRALNDAAQESAGRLPPEAGKIMSRAPEELENSLIKDGALAVEQEAPLFELPLSATFVVGSNGKIVYRFVDADDRKRLDTVEIIRILEGMAEVKI